MQLRFAFETDTYYLPLVDESLCLEKVSLSHCLSFMESMLLPLILLPSLSLPFRAHLTTCRLALSLLMWPCWPADVCWSIWTLMTRLASPGHSWPPMHCILRSNLLQSDLTSTVHHACPSWALLTRLISLRLALPLLTQLISLNLLEPSLLEVKQANM